MKKIAALLMVAVMVVNMVFAMGILVNAQSYKFVNPITGTVQGAGYDENSGHYGIDLYPYNYGDPVYAVASGTISYSCKRNHTKAVQPGDDCCTVKILLDEPLTYNGYTYISAFYTHMSGLVYDVYCGYNSGCINDYNNGLRNDALKSDSIHVNAGDLIGYAGKGNAATHLHLSFETGAESNYHMMANSEIFKVMGWSYNCSMTACEPTDRSSDSLSIATRASGGLTLQQLKEKFPQGKYWNKVGLDSNNADGYTSSPCPNHSSSSTCNTYHRNGIEFAKQCYGFALKLATDAYGGDPYIDFGRAYNLDDIKPGDIINYDGNNPGHTVFVTKVVRDTVYFAECNIGGRCLIRWDRFLKKSQFNNLYSVFVAPYALPGSSLNPTPDPSPSPNLDTRYTVPIKTYPLSSDNHAATAYDSINGSNIGYVYGEDYCTINKIYENGWCQVTCPWGSSTKTVYTQTSNFIQNTSYQVSTITATAKATTYIRPTSSTTLGYIDPGDKIIIVGISGSRTQVIYPHTDGTYRMAWVNSSDITHSHSYGSWTNVNGTSHKRTCSCGDTQQENHTWDSGTVTTNATCSSAGEKTFKCTKCGATKTESIAALGHDYTGSYRDDNVHPHSEYKQCTRCEAKQYTGNTSKVEGCSLCYPILWSISSDGVLTISGVGKMDGYNYSNNQNPPPWALERDKIKSIVVKEGITSIGSDAFSGCNKATNITIPNSVDFIGCWGLNNCGVRSIYIPANVITMQTHVFNDCQNLKDIYCQAASKPAGWDNDWLGNCVATVHWGCSNNPLTCNHTYCAWTSLDDTNHKRTCSICSNAEIAAHTWDSGKVTKAATCTTAGTKTFTCGNCGATKTETIPATGHSYGSAWESDDSSHWHICSCGEKSGVAAHTWDSGKVTKPATATVTGIKTYTCTVCKKTKDETIPKLVPSTGAKIVVGNVTGKPGSTVDLTVTLSGTPKINFIVLYDILYDRSKVELISAKWIQKGADDADYDIGENIMHRDLGSEVVDLNGTVAKITLKIKENIDNCETSVSIKCAAVTLDSRYDIDAFAGTVSILNVIRGDFDNDGELSAVDAIYLKKHIALPSRYPLNQNGDLDGDGRVTAKDALYLKKHIALPSRYPLH